MSYWAVYNAGHRWKRIKESDHYSSKTRNTPKLGFDFALHFSDVSDAIRGIIDVMLDSSDGCWLEFGVVDDEGGLVWSEGSGYKEVRRNWKAYGEDPYEIYDHFIALSLYGGAPTQPQEEQKMSDITEPLHIPRETLIKRLEERKAEELAKREEAVEKGKARRQHLLDAVATLTTDQVANILDRFVTSGNPEALAETVETWVKESKYVSKEAEPTPTETQLDKTIRVLEMAADKEITVKPTDPIFPLL